MPGAGDRIRVGVRLALITTGLARPGRPLLGLIMGLAVVLALAPALSRLPLYRDQTRQQQ